MLPDVYLPPQQQHATGTGVCECVHVNMYTYMSSDQQYVMFKHADHVLYQNILWHA